MYLVDRSESYGGLLFYTVRNRDMIEPVARCLRSVCIIAPSGNER